MQKLKTILTLRKISLVLILALASVFTVSTIVPQELFTAPGSIESWRRERGYLLWLVDLLELHRIFTQAWFLAIALAAAVSLAISAIDQLKVARKRMYSVAVDGKDGVSVPVSAEKLHQVATSSWYRCIETESPRVVKYVRNRCGYWGNTMLHMGLVLVIVTSLYVMATGRQGGLILVEGEQREVLQGWNSSEHGMLVTAPVMPGAVRLDRVTVGFGDMNQPADVTSRITILPKSGRAETLSTKINNTLKYNGFSIYHTTRYGDAFSLEFIDSKGLRHFEKIPIQQSAGPSKAGYGDFNLSWLPYLLSAKYYADVDRKSMTSGTPLLIMRLMDQDRELDRVSLAPGDSTRFGEYRVRLHGVEKWAQLMFVDISGMWLIFSGFAIIMLGGLFYYITPPRELIAVRLPDETCRVHWKGQQFKEFYFDERDRIFAALAEGNI